MDTHELGALVGESEPRGFECESGCVEDSFKTVSVSQGDMALMCATKALELF